MGARRNCWCSRRPAFVEALVGTGDKAFHLLSLARLNEILEPGSAEGMPLSAEASLREALAELLWSGREALPVTNGSGEAMGVVSLERILRHARRPG